MFSFSGNLLAGQHDTQKERPAPSRPTPITFPVLHPPAPSSPIPPVSWTKQQTGISAQFLGLKKPSDVTKDTLSLLNVTFQPECDFKTLLTSLSNNAESHLPPKSWLDSPGDDEPSQTAETTATLLSNGRRAPEKKDFYLRVRELCFKNADAFATLTRKANGGQAPLRLAHFRKFWEGLDNMAYYWDTSLDEYLPPNRDATNHMHEPTSATLPADRDLQTQNLKSETQSDGIPKIGSGLGSPSETEPRKKVKTTAAGNESLPQPINSNGFNVASVAGFVSFISPSRMLPARSAPSKVPKTANTKSQEAPVNVPDGSYRGYRIGNGAEMPDQYRIDCVRAFIEPIAWAFGVTLSQHRRPPVLTLGHIRFPVRMSSAAWRGSQDRLKARQGWMEGPVLGVQCRADVNFSPSENLAAASVLDAVRELGGLLLLAQERARERLTEKRGGEGKWWTTIPRWGGGPGGEFLGVNYGTAKDASSKIEEKVVVERNRDGSKVRRRPTPAEVWNTLKSGNPLWDPKVVYEAIGKDKAIEWDDIFMVSSLNHHISLLKLRVHPVYLQYLTEGKLPEHPPSDPDWCSPKLQRTRWFNLFDVEDRIEAMRGTWGILSYLMRATEEKSDNATMDE